MTAAFSYQRELLIAILVAVWLHVVVFLIFAVLLVFELIAGKVIESAEQEKAVEEMTEISITFEEESSPAIIAPAPVFVPEEETPLPSERPAFANTQDDQEMAEPEVADFIGEKDSVASSDANAVEGDKKETALSGEQEMAQDIKTATEDFSDGPEKGQGMTGEAIGKVDTGDDALTQEETKSQPGEMKPEELAQQDQAPAEFVETMGVEKTLEDQMAKKEPQKKVEPKAEETPPTRKKEDQVAKKEGGSEGGFRTKQTKTRVRGVLNASGKGSLNVKNSPLGRYQASVFKQIERQWQTRNFQFRSHLAPGHISIRFVIDPKGKVSGQQRVEMRGASDIQWGIVLNSIQASDIPAMPREVRKELDGESLELNVIFNY
ncbi:hypothetical protein N8343_03175 [Akkermansiaceae bacterium]|nr:hypothetical protein [Akkermansiaceae bacterium]